MGKDYREWLKQAEYDMGTADYMVRGGRTLYALFMCHLSIEKALKGLYHCRLDKVPPKVHNLVYLAGQIPVSPPDELGMLLVQLNEVSIATRYPEDFEAMQRDYPEKRVREILQSGRRLLQWINEQF